MSKTNIWTYFAGNRVFSYKFVIYSMEIDYFHFPILFLLHITHLTYIYSTSQDICINFSCMCYDNFNHILQDILIGTRAILWQIQCKWGTPAGLSVCVYRNGSYSCNLHQCITLMNSLTLIIFHTGADMLVLNHANSIRASKSHMIRTWYYGLSVLHTMWQL